ncbi:GFA family protein [Piscinibacter terrae]|uniref:GFA family protein n=1 Tax=Piscinibacter terrae TaxID=2496871 RepID=A0A3N7JU41_9BURK|nr:GFA family protein [Albitalea terrae]RQP24449.1 GFA family protein [Albitalea terrae]
MTDKMAASAFTARCYCGAVTLQSSMPPKSVIHCHCNQCRRQSGAAFTTWVSLRREATVIGGEDLLLSHDVSANGSRHFCKRCGSHLFTIDQRYPKVLGVPAGMVDDPSSLVPSGHYFVSHKAPWHEIPDGLPQHGGESGFEPLSSRIDPAR